MVLNAAWSDGAAVTPAVGDIIRVASYDDRGSWDALLFDLTWISDAAAKLGAANDDAALWGV